MVQKGARKKNDIHTVTSNNYAYEVEKNESFTNLIPETK